MSEMTDRLSKYFEETPREQVEADWKATEDFRAIGPTVNDFLNTTLSKMITLVEMTAPAKCKHCKFAQKYRPMKKDGSISWRTKTTCTNPESPMANTDIRQSDFVCERWEL